ncbi:MAG TPA: NAD(P)-dependent oxidoreductase [Chitinophagaceae bacterium]|nr:NAD(P)-dependent oxidoreductase [Chitinophagaceae bacterium]
MLTIGLIREEKTPVDNRVALIPSQCKWIQENCSGVKIIVQHSEHRCFSDREYKMAGIEVREDVSDCDILMGIKEVPVEMLIPGKTYFIFSHTKKLQPHNRQLLQAIIKNGITLIDYECLEHDDGTRILGFGFFAGIVGAHNGIIAFGERSGAFHLDMVNSQKDFRHLIHTYFGLKLPNIKIAVTGSGRVAHGVLEIMNLMGVHETEPDQYLGKQFSYPVYVHLKGVDLYENKKSGKYNRKEFHAKPKKYKNLFRNYISVTDVLMNGVYWQKDIARLFELKDISNKKFAIQTIADISDDTYGSVPCNIRDSTIEDPVYGVDKKTLKITKPYLPGSVDVMAVGNLPNELPRDASGYFGEQIIKYILNDIINGGSEILNKATIVKNGKLNKSYAYMKEYAKTF